MKQKENRKEIIQKRMTELDQQIKTSDAEMNFWKDILEDIKVEKSGHLAPETIEKFKGMYWRYNETIEHMIRSGSDFEQIEALFVKRVALGEIK
jgi:hypothetical protein